MREYPIGFRVQRLNHSAITADRFFRHSNLFHIFVRKQYDGSCNGFKHAQMLPCFFNLWTVFIVLFLFRKQSDRFMTVSLKPIIFVECTIGIEEKRRRNI